MYIYAPLFDSMMACCGRMGLRRGPVYTLTMVALGLGVSLNLLTVLQLLWTLGVLHNPYGPGGDLHAQRFILGTVYLAFLANVVLARRKFGADYERLRATPARLMPQAAMSCAVSSRAIAHLYVFASTSLFVIMLSISLRNA